MYDFQWHKTHGEKTALSAATVIDILFSFLDVDAVLDVGCGDGRWLSVCRARGVADISGVDGPWTDTSRLLIPKDALTTQELSKPFDLNRRFSLIISLEVGEHIDRQFSDIFIDNLARHGDVILFGAAIPYQGGFRHVNEQWQSYWSNLLKARGYEGYDVLRHQIWCNENVHFWYKQNMILYVNQRNVDAVARVLRYVEDNKIQQLPLDIVHPERYGVIASYRQIAFRSLFKELPRQTAKKLGSIVRQAI